MEQWKLIPESEGRYSVSDLGRIRREAYSYKFGDNIVKFETKILTPKPSADYVYFSFSVNKVRFRSAIHRVVAKAFIPNPENKPIVNHKDLDKLNNRLDNLEWATISDNAFHHYLNRGKTKKRPIDNQCFYNMEGEEFRYYGNGFYVSNYGRVYGGTGDKKGFVNLQEKKGYLYFSCAKKQVRINRAVAILFNENKNNDPLVNHINGNKKDNRDQNLEWASHSRNAKHAFDHGLNDMVGEKQSSSKYSKKTIMEVVSLLDSGYSYNQIKNKTGVSTTQISNIKHGHTWTSITTIRKSEKTPLAVLTEKQVKEIKEMAFNGVRLQDIAKIFNQSYVYTFRIATGARWAYVSPELTIKKKKDAKA